MTTLERLQRWYAAQCNGEWEHFHGPTIESCDNPGWWVKIQLNDTALENVPFDPVAENIDGSGFQNGDRWLSCQKKDRDWDGAGDETKLESILQIFLDWAESHGN